MRGDGKTQSDKVPCPGLPYLWHLPSSGDISLSASSRVSCLALNETRKREKKITVMRLVKGAPASRSRCCSFSAQAKNMGLEPCNNCRWISHVSRSNLLNSSETRRVMLGGRMIFSLSVCRLLCRTDNKWTKSYVTRPKTQCILRSGDYLLWTCWKDPDGATLMSLQLRH